MSQTTLTYPQTPLFRVLFSATLLCNKETLPLQTLVDSGADDNIINSSLESQTGIPIEPIASSKDVYALDGRLLARVNSPYSPFHAHPVK